ncbi:hypothetical protein [Aureimonas sp. AU40]|uniref:hypothetical protein n=1 Tax=Aureimonas sp. AU40 TaxID=1637747 RepID=UPI0007848E51|nr:hypothetical protein [Aureimonas sp. AU40]
MKLAIPLLPIMAFLAGACVVPANAQGPETVEVGGDPELDACASLGRIARLDPKGDNFLSVREGPSSKHRERDRLSTGALVTICDERGPWRGIVYPAPGTEADCGVSSPQATRSPYRGPCRSGWVHSRFVDVVAG